MGKLPNTLSPILFVRHLPTWILTPPCVSNMELQQKKVIITKSLPFSYWKRVTYRNTRHCKPRAFPETGRGEYAFLWLNPWAQIQNDCMLQSLTVAFICSVFLDSYLNRENRLSSTPCLLNTWTPFKPKCSHPVAGLDWITQWLIFQAVALPGL